MYCTRYLRPAQIATVALLVSVGASHAQGVKTFDDAPTLDQLRAIMIPESRAGAGRSIVIQRPAPSPPLSSVQPASAPAPTQAQIPSAVTPNRPATQAAPADVTAQPSSPEMVAFHINFAFNSAVLPASAYGMIDRIAQLMKEAPELKMRVEGHTDATGSASYNVMLSEQRARSVTQYLLGQGISPDRLVLVGKGKTEPLTSDPYDPANRRVQFVRTG